VVIEVDVNEYEPIFAAIMCCMLVSVLILFRVRIRGSLTII
jgi:hypothetical protein